MLAPIPRVLGPKAGPWLGYCNWPRPCPTRRSLTAPLAAALLAISSHSVLAQCVPAGLAIPSGTTVTCTGASSQPVGQGPHGAPADGNAVTVNVTDGATLSTKNANAISLGNNATITVGSPSGTATATVTTYSTGGGGNYGTGNNTVEFNNNSTITIYKNGVVSATGTQDNSEAINPYGSGNTVVNYGLIKAGASSAIFFENVNTTGASPRNSVDNYGTIDATGGTNPVTGGEAIGSYHNVGIDIINESGATIKGNLDLQGGNDVVTLETQSVITGNLDGGGGTNVLNLDAASGDSDSLPGVVKDFQSLNKTGPGTWTLTGSVGESNGAPLAMAVQAGTLVLTGNNTNFNGSVTIDPGATLEARAQSLPPLVNDLSGDLLINQVSPDGVQPNDGTYAGVIQGTGVVTKIGVGTTTLTGVSTYSGGTVINQGALAVGADSALGAATGPITFNGGELQLLSSFNLSPSRAISLLAGGGTIDANGFQTTISQAVTGPGALTVADSTASTGVVILAAANTYTGGTTIASGTLQLGSGGTTGSIVGNVTDNGVLAFDRSDVSTFSGVVSGTGSLSQIGSGTTVLTAANTYTGGTTIAAGTLQLGAGGTTGSIVGNVTDNGVLAFNRADVVTFPGIISGIGGVAQIGTGTTILNAVNPYTGPTQVTAGVLAIGDAAHGSALLSGGGPVTVAAGATLGGYGGVAGNVSNFGAVAVADAVPAFSGGPAGAFTIGGNLQNQGVAQIGGAAIGNALVVKGDYGTGAGTGVVAVNTLLNTGGPLSNQATDRLLVFGNASGASSLRVNATGEGAFTGTESPAPDHGISIVQVAGTSSVGAFTLPGGYVNGGTPYRYQLYAFGPGSPNGSASASQDLVGNAGSNWDYRLENVYVTPEGPVTPVEPPPPDSRPELAPQVPAYIALPNALFEAGLQDLDSLHRRLGEIRDDQLVKAPTDGEVFIRGFGGALSYTSNRSFIDNGVNATQDYGATQFGANWIARNSPDGTLRAGLAATLGQLWYEPHAIEGASSGLFDTETLVGALTWQSTAGWYVDGLLSGGLFNGTVSTGARGQALSTNGTSFAASLEAGYPIALGWQGLALEPQLQIVYQNLSFARKTDADAIDVNLGNQSEGVFRAGARLIRPFASSDGALYSAYLKANVLTGLGGGGGVVLGGVPFATGTFGTSIQVGAGANGKINRNLSIYGDVAWQDGVAGGGSRGWQINGGVRYAF